MNPRIPALMGEDVPRESRPILASIEKALGMVPNLHRTLSRSPATLKAYVATVQALSSGRLSSQLREQIAVAVAGHNGCGYCASAHTMLGKAAEVPADELQRNLRGESKDERVAAALQFSRRLVSARGAVADQEIEALHAAGFVDEDIVEIAAHVGMNWFTNSFNLLARTEIDFPVVEICSLEDRERRDVR